MFEKIYGIDYIFSKSFFCKVLHNFYASMRESVFYSDIFDFIDEQPHNVLPHIIARKNGLSDMVL